jgi:exonuclease SbcC
VRPIQLDLHGFASFREEARVDFTDADFFALVGPTGSGKSTVIDAMTFALYGSVPRWGRKGMVSLALAPSAARGTVKLVFEVDRQRYVVARELRRTGSTVNQKAASLERIADPAGLAEPGEATQPLAKDLDGVNEAVEKLLGLKYEDFIQCVVLPQGQFADFLHAKPGERQEILLRLLGAEHYRLMMTRANNRDKVAAQRSATYGEELLGFADATPAAEQTAQGAEAELAGLGDRVAAILPRISERREELREAEGRLRQLRAEAAALAALHVPDGTGQLDADLSASRSRAGTLKAAEAAAEHADTAARAELARGPQRAPLELARAQRAEHTRLQTAVPGLAADVTDRGARAAAAAAAVEHAATALDGARSARDEAARAAESAGGRVTELAAEHARLAAVAVPAGVSALDQRHAAAAQAVAKAAAAVQDAESSETAARAARGEAPAEAPAAQATRVIEELRALRASGTAAEAAARRAAAAQRKAVTALAAAEQARETRQAELDAARQAHVVADLRPHLVAGEPCPVCEQPVATLPPPLTSGAVDAAQDQLAAAYRALNAARAAARDTDLTASKAQDTLAVRAERQTTLAGELSGLLSGPLARFSFPGLAQADPAYDDAIDQLAQLDLARQEAGELAERTATLAREARMRHRSAQQQAETAAAELTAAAAALRTARDPLVSLGAPAVDGTGLAEGWGALERWAAAQSRARAGELDQARQAETAAARQHQELTTAFSAAESALAAQRAAAKAASDDDQRTRERLSQATARVSELGDLLSGAPTDAEITAQLAERDRLEAAAAAAEGALRAARSERSKGETALAGLEDAERTARAQLSAARDRVVALGAPPVADQGLLGGWTGLVAWAAGEAKLREAGAGAAGQAADTARSGGLELARQLSAELAQAGIDLPPETAAASAASAVAGALEKARGVTARIAERRERAADLIGKQRAATEEQQVAHLLGNLLQARQFPQWLVSEALDDLVATASQTLAALTSGQFDLAHSNGDLFVVDHGDADSRRSVRTLSGGETFQASLALALALSSQISSLAAAGAARLDSIFLDEGFGTLDPETLEVVATTLESLAQGDRMVGVVTHVAELAERVPVRFRVTRNARTSVIVREGLPAIEAVTLDPADLDPAGLDPAGSESAPLESAGTQA